jgi:hypothetical protein
MSETTRTAKTTETSPGIAREPINHNMDHPHRKLWLRVGAYGTTLAAGAALTFGIMKGVSGEAEPLAEPETTTSFELIEPEVSNVEKPTLETFPFVVDGQEYTGIDELKEALTIQATPGAEYPGLPMSDERDAALQTEVNGAVEQWVKLSNQLLNYQFTDEQREEYADYRYDAPNGEVYLGVDGVRAEVVGEAFRDIMTAQSTFGDPYPQEMMDDLIHFSVVADWESQKRIEAGGEPLEITLSMLEGTEEIGGTELVDNDFIAFGTVQIETSANRVDGDGVIFDLTGTRGIDCVNSTEPVTWQLAFENMEQEDGTAEWKVTRAIVYDAEGENVVCGNLPQ